MDFHSKEWKDITFDGTAEQELPHIDMLGAKVGGDIMTRDSIEDAAKKTWKAYWTHSDILNDRK